MDDVIVEEIWLLPKEEIEKLYAVVKTAFEEIGLGGRFQADMDYDIMYMGAREIAFTIRPKDWPYWFILLIQFQSGTALGRIMGVVDIHDLEGWIHEETRTVLGSIAREVPQMYTAEGAADWMTTMAKTLISIGPKRIRPTISQCFVEFNGMRPLGPRIAERNNEE